MSNPICIVQNSYYMVALQARHFDDFRKLSMAAQHLKCHYKEENYTVTILVLADTPEYAKSQAATVAEEAGVELDFIS